MRKYLILLGVAALVVLTSTATLGGSRGVEFKPLGFIDDPGPFPYSGVLDMNADGTVLVTTPSWSGGYCTFTDPETLEWTLIGGAFSCTISADGSTLMAGIYDENYRYRSAIWNGSVDDWTMLPLPDGAEGCGSSLHSFYDMGGNADYATGLTSYDCSTWRAYKWDAVSNESVSLGTPNGDSTRGNAITDDGSKVAGWGTMLCGSRRGASHEDGTWTFTDGQGNEEPKNCISSGGACCSDSYCPEYINDGLCNNAGYCDLTGIACEAGVCTGGVNAGNPCSGYWNCPGQCAAGPSTGAYCTSDYSCPGECTGGPDVGASCTSNWSCDDTPVCVKNDNWTNEAFKGEVYDMTPDGQYMVGEHYGESSYDWSDPLYDPYLWASAYRTNPDGSFVQIPPPPGASPYDSWTPYAISDDGGTVVGTYGWWIFSYPVIWTEETGTLDLQWFLIGQGLDELWFWYLTHATSVSADGKIIGGMGQNEDWWIEGFVLDISKAKICHAPPGNPENARTISVDWDSLGDHLAHGDELATCEFLKSGARSRSMSEIRPQRPEGARPQIPMSNWADFDARFQQDKQGSGVYKNGYQGRRVLEVNPDLGPDVQDQPIAQPEMLKRQLHTKRARR